MAIAINGDGTIGGLAVGGLPNGTVTRDDLATTAIGSILQVVQSVKTDVASMTGITFTDMGLSAIITPSSVTSKILVLIQANIGGSIGYSMKSRLVRNATPLYIGDAAGSRPRASVEATGIYSGGNQNAAQFIITYLDSPATTSATTYKIQYASYVASYILYMNRSGVDTNAATHEARTASSITLMEVAG